MKIKRWEKVSIFVVLVCVGITCYWYWSFYKDKNVERAGIWLTSNEERIAHPVIRAKIFADSLAPPMDPIVLTDSESLKYFNEALSNASVPSNLSGAEFIVHIDVLGGDEYVFGITITPKYFILLRPETFTRGAIDRSFSFPDRKPSERFAAMLSETLKPRH